MTDPSVSQAVSCPACLSESASVFLDIPSVPVLCNVLSETQEEAQSVPRGEIQLAFCPECGHVFNQAFDADRLAYSERYENALHFSPRFRQYATSLADYLIDRYDLHEKDVIDLGCGDGDFLELLCERGNNRGLGFDPSYRPPATPPRFTVIRELYDERHAGYRADLICCRHVLEHIERPRPFLETVRRTVGDRLDTGIFFEVPNVRYTLEQLAIWDLIYEHCGYFSPASLTRLFRTSGFIVDEVSEVYGGQFVCVDARASVDEAATHPAEETASLAAEVDRFAVRFGQKVAEWRGVLERLRAEGTRAAIWGAGSKGVTILNLLDARELVTAVVDINPRKQGMYVAGTGHQIVAPAGLAERPPDTIIVMNPLYLEEIGGILSEIGIQSELIAA